MCDGGWDVECERLEARAWRWVRIREREIEVGVNITRVLTMKLSQSPFQSDLVS